MVDSISRLVSGSSFLTTCHPLPYYQGRRLDNTDLIESIDRVTTGLAETLTLVDSIRYRSAEDCYGPIYHSRPTWPGHQRRLDLDLEITMTLEGRMVRYHPVLTTSLRSGDYKALIEHSSNTYPYGLINVASEYTAHIPHLFMDPTERDHI
jgi:hypothetical protein